MGERLVLVLVLVEARLLDLVLLLVEGLAREDLGLGVVA